MADILKKFWNISQIDEESTDLMIYDGIAMKTSRDFYTDEVGTEVTPTAFIEDLTNISTNKICVRINSCGGDVFAAESIANAIKEEREKGKVITCKIDGICASAAVQIAMACEKISIPSSAYMMIHDPLSFLFGYYQVADLTKCISTLDKIKSGIVNAYASKTGIDKKEIENLMTAETWFTGDEAVEKGFADELLFDEVEEEETVVNGIKFNFAAFTNVPENIKRAFNVKNISKNNQNPKAKGDNEMEFKNAAELMAAFPDFVNEITQNAKDEATKAERERMQAIDELAGKVDGEMLNKAKYETFENAETVAYNAMKEGKFVNTAVINALADDAKDANGVDGVANDGFTNEDETAKAMKAEFDAIDKIASKKFGR